MTPTVPSTLDAIERYVTENGRPLDVARFNHLSGRGNAQDVADALAGFQNEDGGFGHGLEGDLQANYDTDAGRWMPVSEAVNAHPHAGWWHFEAEKGGTSIHQSPWNPTAALTGYLWHYGFAGPVSLETLTEGAIAYLKAQADTDIEMHELHCLVQFTELAPAPHVGPLRELTMAAVERIVERERTEWEG